MNHSVIIERIIAGGKGLARTATGQIIMSAFVLPDETVELREVKKKFGYIEGEAVRVLKPSPARVSPTCMYYGQCGGCDLQHADYAEQLQIKKAVVEESIQRVGVPLPAAGVEEPLPSPLCWGYRYRLRLKINRIGQLGFFQKRSNRFVAVSSCPVAADGINAAVAELEKTGALHDLTGICREAELLQSSADNRITLVLLLRGKKKIPVAITEILAACAHIHHIGCTSRKGFRYISPQAKPLSQSIALPRLQKNCTLSWSASCFSQVNPEQNAQLIQQVCALAGELSGKTVLDCYCGMGNFSIPLGLCGGTITGIEGSRESVQWAEKNANRAGITAHFFAADVHNSLRQLANEGQRADLILLDPPRTGIGKTAALLPELCSERIIYISCNPATLARDLRILCDKGCRLIRLIPLDMFPQTGHIESVALLEKT